MGGSILPFLALLKKQVPDFSGMTADDPSLSEQAQQAQALQQEPSVPTPSLSVPGQQPQTPPPDPNQPLSDVAQSMTQGQQAPKFKEPKGHMLLRLLQSGLQGGLAGMAANAQTYAQTGRNAGFGGGYQGAFQLPFQQAYERGQLTQQAAQTDLLKAQSQMVPTPYGNMPAAFAKMLFPALARGQATVQAAQVGAQGRMGAAQITAGKPVVVPGRGLFAKDENGKYQPVQGAEVPNVLVTADEAQSLGHPELANQEIDMQRYSSLLRGVSSQYAVGSGASGPAVINKRGVAQGKPGSAVSAGLGSPAMGGIAPIVSDPNNPGIVTYAPKSAAVGAMAPGAAPVQTAKATARAMAPGGKVGEEINAFNTAIQHADLLTSAVKALNNGDQQTLNSITNRFKDEFGVSGPVTAQAIADAYTREVTKMLSSGHMTDSEIGTVGSTLNPSRQSPEQTLGVIEAYKALAQSKMNVRRQGVQQGLQGKPNFPAQEKPSGGFFSSIPGAKPIK